MQTWCRLCAEMCRLQAELMQTSIKVCVSRTFFYHTPIMHKLNHADFMYTFTDIMQTLCSYDADYYMLVHLAHFYVIITGNFLAPSLTPPWRIAGTGAWCSSSVSG